MQIIPAQEKHLNEVCFIYNHYVKTSSATFREEDRDKEYFKNSFIKFSNAWLVS